MEIRYEDYLGGSGSNIRDEYTEQASEPVEKGQKQPAEEIDSSLWTGRPQPRKDESEDITPQP